MERHEVQGQGHQYKYLTWRDMKFKVKAISINT